jgi:hypothetical protein
MPRLAGPANHAGKGRADDQMDTLSRSMLRGILSRITDLSRAEKCLDEINKEWVEKTLRRASWSERPLGCPSDAQGSADD